MDEVSRYQERRQEYLLTKSLTPGAGNSIQLNRQLTEKLEALNNMWKIQKESV